MSGAGRIVLAGGSGFLGRSLAQVLVRQGYEVAVLSRRTARQSGAVRFLQWDGKTVGAWSSVFEGARAIVNLTGKSVNCRYTRAARAEIFASRLDSVCAVGEAISRCAQPPPVLVQASSLAIYGNSGDRIALKIRRMAPVLGPRFAKNGRPRSTLCPFPRPGRSRSASVLP